MYEFLEAVSGNKNKHHYFKNVASKTPSWQSILALLNKNIISGAKMKMLDNLGFVCFDAHLLPEVEQLLLEIKKTTTNSVSAHCYISLLQISKTFGRHNDNADVFFWQVQGSTKWCVEDTEVAEYTLQPGDVIYVPRFMIHEVTPLEPRAGISIGIDY